MTYTGIDTMRVVFGRRYEESRTVKTHERLPTGEPACHQPLHTWRGENGRWLRLGPGPVTCINCAKVRGIK